LEPGDAQELAGERQVVFGRGLQGADVGVGDARWQGARPGHRGDGQVGAGGQLPGEVDRRGGGLEEPPRQVGLAAGQALLQCGRLQRGHRHVLAVDGVEAADRIAGDQQPGRERPAHARAEHHSVLTNRWHHLSGLL